MPRQLLSPRSLVQLVAETEPTRPYYGHVFLQSVEVLVQRSHLPHARHVVRGERTRIEGLAALMPERHGLSD